MSSFGKLFKITTFGESHGIGVGCIVENVPPMLKLTNEDIQYQLNRRKPNQNSLLSARNEPDLVEIYSGVQDGVTLGTPVCLIVKNIDMKPGDYKKFSTIPRPGHADMTYLSKYGVKSSSGGGRASARETVARVAGGSIAEKYLNDNFSTEIVAWVNSIGDIEIPKEITKSLFENKTLSKELIDSISSFKIYKKENNENELILYNTYNKSAYYQCIEKIETICNEINIEVLEANKIRFKDDVYLFSENINVRCPHPETAVKMILKIIQIKLENDSIGGTVNCIIKKCPRSLGEPCFDKFEAELAKAMLSIPATKGFEIGSGFEGTKLK